MRRDLRKFEPLVAKELRRDERRIATEVAKEASGRAVRLTGEYAKSFKPSVTNRGAAIVSKLPQAGVVHFGGTIRPRGVPIVFKPRPVVSDVIDEETDQIVDQMGDAVERAARSAGWT